MDETSNPFAGEVAVTISGQGEATPNPPTVGEQDSRLAGILAAKQAGAKLSASDRGYLGSRLRGQRTKAPAAATANPLLKLPVRPENPLFEAGGGGQAAPQVEIAAAVDSALLRSTAEAILSSVDSATKLYIGHEVTEAGGNAETKRQYQEAVAMQPDNKALMVDNSEPFILKACEIFGTSPDKLKGTIQNSGFIAGLVAHGLGVMTAVKQIREMKASKPKGQP